MTLDQFMSDIQETIATDTGYFAVEDEVPLLYMFMHDTYISWWLDTEGNLARERFLYAEDVDGHVCLTMESLTRYQEDIMWPYLLGLLPTRFEIDALREVEL